MNAKKVMLLILDGWGYGQKEEADAIANASTPVMDSLKKTYPNSTLVTHGEQVGLPDGQMGNSEVGHLNIGAGRIVYQELLRINNAIRSGELQQHPVLLEALQHAKVNDKQVHFIGLVSDGGVHSHIDHLLALCEVTQEVGLENVFIHAFMDGRDTDPKGGAEYLETIVQSIDNQNVRIASVIGRYFAMDRDKRWGRVKLAYDLLVNGQGEQTTNPIAAIKKRYEAGETDEFIKPMVCVDADGNAIATVNEEDVLICFNFRTDRPREISQVLTQVDMPEFGMSKLNLKYVTMTRYDETFKGIDVIFDKDNLTNTIGEVLSKAGKSQTRIAETEKYPHVTFFFNGGREEPFEDESRIMIPSPKVATYDLKPEMSAIEITEAIINNIGQNQPDFICLNYANTDMVGHTGIWEAAIKAAETVDSCLGQLLEVGEKNGYDAIVIADHGNSDYLINEDGSPHTAHTMNPVPFIYINQSNSEGIEVKDGKLADIAPTVLTLMGIGIPDEMDGENLISKTT